MRPLIAIAALVALSSIGGTAHAKPAPKDRTCFHQGNVSSFRAPDEHNVYVRVGVRDVYQLEMMGACPQIDWAEKVAIVTRGSQWICSGLDADLVSPTSIGPQRCPVKMLRKLTAEEAAALPAKAKP